MRIVVATDHAGFTLKEYVKEVLHAKGYAVEDVGAHEYEPGDDYPDYIAAAARIVSSDPQNVKAILFGGSGQGEAIVANRFSNVRATVYYGEPVGKTMSMDMLALTRMHNDANVLSLGARFLRPEDAEEAVLHWLASPYEAAERHERRIKKIDSISTD